MGICPMESSHITFPGIARRMNTPKLVHVTTMPIRYASADALLTIMEVGRGYCAVMRNDASAKGGSTTRTRTVFVVI